MHSSSWPDQIIMKTKEDDVFILDKEDDVSKLFGLAPKAIYKKAEKNSDEKKEAEIFFVKCPKTRHMTELFVDALPEETLSEIADRELNMEDYRNYKQHKIELEQTHAFLEILAPRIAKSIFGNLITVPDNYLLIVNGMPVILSKRLQHFHEFLSEEKVVEGIESPHDWETLPQRKDLNFSNQQAVILGQLCFIGLLLGHWDLFNIVNFSNSGSSKSENGALVSAIVDWGNALGAGFCGLSAEEMAFRNADFPEGKIYPDDGTVNGFQHCVPFDEIVYPLLPRIVVRDLFNMSDKDEISQAMLKGFKQAHSEAQKALKNVEVTIAKTIEDTLMHYVHDEDVEYIQHLLNQEVFFPKKNQKSDYTLANILKGRIKSLAEIVELLDKGFTFEQIAQKRLEEMVSAQKGDVSSVKKGIFSPSTESVSKSTSSEESTFEAKKPQSRA